MSWVRQLGWSCARDKEGHRDYSLHLLVMLDVATDGPASVLVTPGLPIVGSAWAYGTDFDSWAFCTPEVQVSPWQPRKGELNYYWQTKHKFSTKPWWRCQDQEIEDPLLEPQKVSGSFLRYTEMTDKDKDGNLILSSSPHDIIKVERDRNRPTVTVEQNVSDLELDTVSSMVDTVNDASLWGLGARKIKLGNVSWSRKVWGTCNFYYTRRFEFEVRFEGFDYTDIVDAGKWCLRGEWSKEPNAAGLYTWTEETKDGGAPLDATDKGSYHIAKDHEGNREKTLLDGTGSRLTGTSTPVFIDPPEIYDESNFLLLGIPTTL